MAIDCGVEGRNDPSDTSDTDSSSTAAPPPKQRCGRAVVAVGLLTVVALAALFVLRAPLMHKNEDPEQIVTASVDPLLNYKGPLTIYAGTNDNASSLLRDVLPRKPLQKNFRKWGGSAAVVSSSGALLGSGLGALIDSHDIVLRFNYAPCKGYEEDVGARTDIRLLGKNHMFWEDEHERAIHRYHTPQIMWNDLPLMAQLGNPTTNRLYALSERFTTSTKKQMNNINPSSGFVGVMFALHEFEDVSIFGFHKMDLDRAASEGHYHYFNDTANFVGPVMAFHRRYNLSDDSMIQMKINLNHGVHAGHDMPHEWDLYDQFERLGRLKQYEGKGPAAADDDVH